MSKWIFRWSMRLALGLLFATSMLSTWQWSTSELHSIDSVVLRDMKTYRVFYYWSQDRIIYSLDGNTFTNSLAPAVLFSVAVLLRGRASPQVVAIYSDTNRNLDFMPTASAPTYWRPQIIGRSNAFEIFLIQELMPKIEGENANGIHRYLSGHSLSGLYAIDLATRKPGRFTGIFAFAPTFSHDTSIAARLPMACNANTVLYTNWGLESARDTEVFTSIVAGWKADRRCRANPPLTPRHYGAVHQIVMLTGQIHTGFWLFN